MAREAPFQHPRDLDLGPSGLNYDEPPPVPFAPRQKVNLEELARQIEQPPLKGVAEAIAALKFHELMEMAEGLKFLGPEAKTEPNYVLASSLSAWALAQLKA